MSLNNFQNLNIYDECELIACKLVRRANYNGFGLSLSNLNKKMLDGTVKDNQITTPPVITFVECGSPSDFGGLKKDDLLLEINGVSVIGQYNLKIAQLLRTAGNSIELLVNRRKVNETLNRNNDYFLIKNANLQLILSKDDFIYPVKVLCEIKLESGGAGIGLVLVRKVESLKNVVSAENNYPDDVEVSVLVVKEIGKLKK